MNDPEGAVACPESLSPQQSMVLSVRNPHECLPPAETWVNDPEGASACPRELSPQHETVPSVRNAQE